METLEEYPEYRISAVFKSYYVVWKPQETKKDEKEKNSLNRTMQYGNLQ